MQLRHGASTVGSEPQHGHLGIDHLVEDRPFCDLVARLLAHFSRVLDDGNVEML